MAQLVKMVVFPVGTGAAHTICILPLSILSIFQLVMNLMWKMSHFDEGSFELF